MAKEQGISVADATKRLGEQRALGDRGNRLEKSLAGREGDSYLDDNGRLVVNTLDAAGDAVVRHAGALPHRVDDSSARLDNILHLLDRQAARSGVGTVQGWYVDVPTNTVVVTATTGAKDAKALAITKLASRFGASVRIEHRPASQAPRTTETLRGGFQYIIATGQACSIGFNTVDSLNRNVVLTAGHCVKKSGTMSRNGYAIGAHSDGGLPDERLRDVLELVPVVLEPTPSVWKYNNTYVNVVGVWNNPPVGATVCKSGRTTGYSCGKITALNRTVNYPEGMVYGLVQHNNCVEGGDSGGSNISGGAYALGVTSGASMIAGKCQSKYGYTNVSYYQPIGEALQANGLRVLIP